MPCRTSTGWISSSSRRLWSRRLGPRVRVLIGPGGLLTGLTKSVLETALEAELTEHLGYEQYDVAGRDGGNSRNGTRAKTGFTPDRAGAG